MKDATLGHGVKILQMLDQKEISGEQVQKIIGSGLLSDLLDANIGVVDRNEFRKLLGLNPLNVYRVVVDYEVSIEKAIKAGKYDWVNSDITSKNFPTKKSGTAEIEIELVHFNRIMNTDEVLAELDKGGLRSAEIHDLLKLGEKFPDLQKEFPIIALGFVWQDPPGYRCCPYLYGDGSERVLYLSWIDDGWYDDCCFVALRK